MIFAANVVVSGGTITYSLKSLKTAKIIPPAFFNFLIFLNIIFVSEYIYRKKARSDNLVKNEDATHNRTKLVSERITKKADELMGKKGKFRS